MPYRAELGLKLDSDEFRTTHSNALQALIELGKTVVGAVRTTSLVRTEARLDIRAWKDNANAVRLATYGELLTLAAKKGRNKDWAEVFFLSAQNAPEVYEDDDAEDESTVETPANG